MMLTQQPIRERIIAERYSLQDQIGNGRMSTVYRALDRASKDSQVAVKVLNSSHADEIKRELFKRDTSALKSLRHPNIVSLLDNNWSEPDKSFYLVLEYLPYSLDRYLKGELQSQLDKFEPYRVMRELTEALAYAHSEHVIHRDIKPSNILLDENARPKLTDYGISKFITQLTVGETLAGFWSSGYASPEQRAGATANRESDIYSLGSVFFHLLSGKEPPPEGPTPDMVDEFVKSQPPLKNVLKRMLAYRPEQRFSTGAELLSALDVTRRHEYLPRCFLILTKTAIRNVVDAGYAIEQDVQSIAEVLIEDLGGRDAEDVHIRRDQRDQRDIIILGDSLRLICTPHESGDALVVKAVQTPYLPRLEGEKNRSMSCRVYWEPAEREFRSGEKSFNQNEAVEELTSLLAQLDTYETVGVVSEERRRSRRDFIENWDIALRKKRNQIEGQALALRYSEVIEDPDYLRFTLTNPPLDSLNWEDDTPLAVRQNVEARRLPVGNLVRIRGSIVEVARQGNRLRKDDSPIPKTGLLTVNVTEALSANTRQRNAVNAFLHDQMVNPALARVIVDPSTATHTSETDLDYFQKMLSDDKDKMEAVSKAISSNELFLIQGPPGTGKTSVIAEIVLQILKRDPSSRILLTSQSNVAVDHVLTKIEEAARKAGDSPPEMVRIGRSEKIGPGGESWTLEERTRSWRQEVLDNCAPELAKLRQAERQARRDIKSAEEVLDSDVENTGVLEEWIAEAKEIAAQLREYEHEQSSLGTEASAATTEEIADMVKQTHVELKQQLEALNGLLPEPIDFQDKNHEDVLTEIIKATVPSRRSDSELGDPATKELHRIQELRRTLTDWRKVVGRTQDFQMLIGSSSRVVAATCLFSGGRRGQAQSGAVRFDWAIVDEAGRATVPEVLIPIVRSERVILVGDERQLPPMVEDMTGDDSLNSQDENCLDTSLFQSIVEQAGESGHDHLANLRTQYRMHPAIGNLVSDVFYEGKLKNGEQIRSRTFEWMPAPVTWVSTSSMPNRAETRVGDSYANPTEADIVLHLLKKMEEKCRECRRKPSVGVICGYSGQVEHLTTYIDPEDNVQWQNLQIEIATVDSFQGRDCDVVVYSTVRSNKDKRIGFLKDRRRINVALSRARELLVIVGDHYMMETATIGAELNPFASVLDYIRLHPNQCKINQPSLVKLL